MHKMKIYKNLNLNSEEALIWKYINTRFGKAKNSSILETCCNLRITSNKAQNLISHRE